MSDRRVLVVGATSDYIDIIGRRFPGRAVFLTDRAERAAASEPAPDGASEALCGLRQPHAALPALRDHTARWGIELTGVACFDCESMALAAELARALRLPYPTAEAVAACRSKFASKQRWQEAGVRCPRVALVRGEADALRFIAEIGAPAVLKPLTGSGSELTFLCDDARACVAACRTMEPRLREHPDDRMYAPPVSTWGTLDPRRVFAIEEFVQGCEYSCDFVLDRGRVEIIRLAEKVPASALGFGTTLAYVVPGELPSGLDRDALGDELLAAAQCLGLERALCMVDFIVRDGRAWFIEMAPRPGGDCLPPLLWHAAGLDVFQCALDFAEGRSVTAPGPSRWRRLVGLRLFATRAGIIHRLAAQALHDDPRVLECHLKRGPGDRVALPPEDYDSRILGHVVFEPSSRRDTERECVEIAGKLVIEMEQAQCAIATTC